jgi:2'-5' RNA ligase
LKEYSISLIFDKDVEGEMIQFSQRFRFKHSKSQLNKGSKPHCTLVKWKTDYITEKQLSRLKKLMKPIEVVFSGITVLPARESESDGGFWLEISILKSDEIIDMVEKIVSTIGEKNVINPVGKLLRPHVTISRSYDKSITIKNLNPNLLRKKVIAKPTLGIPGKSFEFYV